MKNLISITKKYQPKNKLAIEILARANSLDRLLVNSEDITEVINNFRETIARANARHLQCTSEVLKVYHDQYTPEHKDYILEVENVVMVKIFASKGNIEL